MKIGELFIALGFKVEGREDFDAAQAGLKSAAGDAGKLAVAVNVVNAALLAMIDTAMRAGTALQVFRRETGANESELQLWEQAGRAAGGAAGAIKQAATAIAEARASFALGDPQAVGIWQILGVDPRADPFAVLAALRQRIRGIADPAVAKSLLGKVGLEGAFPALQLPDADFARLRREFVITPQQVDRLAQLNREWERFVIGLSAAKNEIVAALAPALAVAARGLEWLAGELAAVAAWLNSNTGAARVARYALGALVIGSLALGVALAGLVALMGALVTLTIAASPALLTVAAALLPLAAAVGLVVGGLAALILLLDDFWTAAEGGKSLFDWNDGLLLTLKNVDRLAKAIEFLIDKAKLLRDFGSLMTPGGSGAATGYLAERFVASSAQPAGGSGSYTQTNAVDIHVDGSRTPQATGFEVAKSFKEYLASTARQAPVPNY